MLVSLSNEVTSLFAPFLSDLNTHNVSYAEDADTSLAITRRGCCTSFSERHATAGFLMTLKFHTVSHPEVEAQGGVDETDKPEEAVRTELLNMMTGLSSLPFHTAV